MKKKKKNAHSSDVSLASDRQLFSLTVRTVYYRGASLIRNTPLIGPYSRTIPRVIWWS